MDADILFHLASLSADQVIRDDVRAEVDAVEKMVKRNLETLEGLDIRLEEVDAVAIEESDCLLMLARLGHMQLEMAQVSVFFSVRERAHMCTIYSDTNSILALWGQSELRSPYIVHTGFSLFVHTWSFHCTHTG